jgi:hypothetical protein
VERTTIAGETEELGENLPQRHFVPPQIPIHALSGIRIHDSSVRASEVISCLRPHGHCDRPLYCTVQLISSDNDWHPVTERQDTLLLQFTAFYELSV